MQAGDIILIRFPQTNLEIGNLRPALILASSPSHHSDVLITLISSQLRQSIPKFDNIINEDDSDFDLSGLKVSSVVRLSRLATVETAVIKARLGTISPQRLNQIKQTLTAWLQK